MSERTGQQMSGWRLGPVYWECVGARSTKECRRRVWRTRHVRVRESEGESEERGGREGETEGIEKVGEIKQRERKQKACGWECRAVRLQIG